MDEKYVIRVTDNGVGMTEVDLEKKFLVVSRQRREEEGTALSPGGRLVMGRNGLGKLAGFGVAHKITIYSKTADAPTAHRITLDYDEFQKEKNTSDLKVPLDEIEDWRGWFPEGQGTVIELSKLVYANHRQPETIQKHIGKSFRRIKDFTITFNGAPLAYTPAEYAYQYPPNELLGADERADCLAHADIQLENGKTAKIKYRIGFFGSKGHLTTDEYGLSVYCHNRLAAKPDTFNIKTSTDGYIYHTYMDGVVEANFIDEQKLDCIATNRQSLVWNGLLEPVQIFLHDKVTEALSAYAKAKETKDENDVKNSEFTKITIQNAKLKRKRKTEAFKIAKASLIGLPPI